MNDKTHLSPPVTVSHVIPSYTLKFLAQNKRQTTSRMVAIVDLNPINVFISQKGTIAVFDRNLHVQKMYESSVQDLGSEEPSASGQRSIASSPCWVTDMLFMEDCMKLIITTTRRCIYFYDISASNHMEEFRLSGLPAIPTCMACSHNEELETTLLVVGDNEGGLTFFNFTEPETLLFCKSEMVQVEKIHFQDIEKHHRRYCQVRQIRRIHGDSVNQIQLDASQETVLSCSDDPQCSVRVAQLDELCPPYIFCQNKGVRCFDMRSEGALLVTGGRDGIVRLWTLYAPAGPSDKLRGHNATIIAVRLLRQPIIISLAIDAVLKVWSCLSGQCLHTLPLLFPATSPKSSIPFGPFPLLQLNDQRFLIAAGEWVADVRLTDSPIGQGNLSPKMMHLPTKQRRSKKQYGEYDTDDDGNEYRSKLLFARSEARFGKQALSRERTKQLVDEGGAHWALVLFPLAQITLPTPPESLQLLQAKKNSLNNT